MEEKKVKLTIYRKQSLEEFTASVADPEDKPEIGSSAAAAAALAAALLHRASVRIPKEKLNDSGIDPDWYDRNAEILRSYMTRLVDEDVKCRAPLKKALKEDDDRRIEAARQSAISICLEIVNMMGKCLEMAEKLIKSADAAGEMDLLASADLAFAASKAAGRYILSMSRLSPDETYQYVIRRENELTMADQKSAYQRIQDGRKE